MLQSARHREWNKKDWNKKKMKLETENGYILSEQTVICGYSRQIGIYGIATVANALAAQGAKDIVVSVRIEIPTFGYQSRIHGLEKSIRKICKEKEIKLLEMKTGKNPVLKFAQVIVCGMAAVENMEVRKPKAGDALVLMKWPGMEGMLRVTQEREEELKERFSPTFLEQIKSYDAHIFSMEEAKYALEAGAKNLRQIGEGGIFAELYRLSVEEEFGVDVELHKITLLQETVEVCEQYHLNPYQMTSAGSFLAVAEDGVTFARKMGMQNIPVSVIGYLTDNNDKIIRNGEEVRYIDRPATDAVFEIFKES